MLNSNILKNFYVLEGLDGSGTTTQLDSLSKLFQNNEINYLRTFEPTDGYIGKTIRNILSKKEIANPETIAFLFAADRNEHLYNKKNGIKKCIDLNYKVICDRYLFSSLAYQSMECDFDFVASLNKEFPLPEHLFFLDISPEEGNRRITKRNNDIEIYEDLSKQIKINEQYKKVLKYYENTEMQIHIIDATKKPESISKIIWNIIN